MMNRPKCAVLIAVIMQITCYVQAGEISLDLSERLQCAQKEEYLSVIIHMVDQTDPEMATKGIVGRNKALRLRNVIRTLQSKAKTRQGDLIAFLEKEKSLGNVLSYTPFWIFNGFSIKARPAVIESIASREDVEIINLNLPIFLSNSIQTAPQTVTIQNDSPYNWNIEKINAPEVWKLGIDGSGVVVGTFDSGVDITHPDLAEKYRGGNNSWFDPFGEHDEPIDNDGHGTHVTGTILGGNASGKHIGVAPGAQFISARVCDDEWVGDIADAHIGLQWLMDPDGDPETDDAPDVINNSWLFFYNRLFLCHRDLQDDFKALRAAGIIPVFSAGNTGPLFFTSSNPANYPEMLAVGATTRFDSYAIFSSRGPNSCDLSIFPDITAPGFRIYSSIPNNNYDYMDGTSQAAPHVTGVIALMLDANPELTVDEIESILKTTAKPLGIVHPNNTFGWGRVDALAAVNAALSAE